jgi:thiol-disulfide isomerase/thioredoxin
MKIIKLALLIAPLFFYACKNESNINIQPKYVATINENGILLATVDSVIQQEIFQLRLTTLQKIISHEILKYEANKRGLSLDTLVFIEITSKSINPDQKELNLFINNHPDYKNDSISAIKLIKVINQKKRYELFIDSLKRTNYHVEIKLKPVEKGIIDTENLYSFVYNSAQSNIEVILIANYDCSSCLSVFDDFDEIVKRYNKSVDFRLIYLDSYYGITAKALIAAEKQNKFKEMHTVIIHNTERLSDTSLYFEIASVLNIDTVAFKKDFKDNTLLQDILVSRDLLFAQGVISTPSFIINGKIYDDENVMDYLDGLIIDELKSEYK